MENEELKHVGVLGMKWGRRRARLEGNRSESKGRLLKAVGLKKLGGAWDRDAAKWRKKEHDLDTEIQNIKGHSDRVKGLKLQLKAAKTERANKQWDHMVSQENKHFKDIDATKKQKLSEINASSLSKGKKFIARAKLNKTARKLQDEVVTRTEDEYISSRQSVKKSWRKKADEIALKWAKEVDTRWDNETKGKNPIEAIKIGMKIDREESRRLTENLLAAEAEHYEND